MKNIAIIGGGAAGYFAAINIKEQSSNFNVTILEATKQPLAKVRVSGGGRCNLTNSFLGGEPLSKLYPRGEKVMRNVFKVFNHQDSYEWFEKHGIKLTTQSDNCVFPQSQRSSEIINMFERSASKLGIELKTSHKVVKIKKVDDKFEIYIKGVTEPLIYDIVVATTGGSQRSDALSIFDELPLRYKTPIPSLFTFNISDNPITELSGAVIDKASVALKGTKLRSSGALLITHWGVSGPAILKLSSYGAQKLYESDYKGAILISWAGETRQEVVLHDIKQIIAKNSKKLVGSVHPYDLTSRVWAHILRRADISHERRLGELGSKGINRIVAALTSDEYQIDGKGVNKEEFVTTGGIAISSINPATLQSRLCDNLYFAGELLDVDAITGGYNLQAAWSTAFAVAKSINNL